MQGRFSGISTAFVLVFAVISGWSLSFVRPALLHAGASGRQTETTLTTGPVHVLYDEATKSPIPLDGIYILDYKGGRLVATVPTYRQSTGSTTVIESFVERDLAADFKLDLDTGRPPHFLMTTGSLGPFTAGWAPLYVVETTTNQMGVYRISLAETSGKTARSKFELVQLRSYAKPEATSPLEADPLRARALERPGETILTTGPVLVRFDQATKAAIPLEAVYILDCSSNQWRLVATVPTYRQTTGSTTVIESFVERNLAVDFKLDLDTGRPPHFLMSTGSLGPFTAGWAPLYVVETTTNQVGVYRIHLPENSGKSSRSKFELVQLRSYAKPAATAASKP